MTNAEIAAFLKGVPYFAGLEKELIESIRQAVPLRSIGFRR